MARITQQQKAENLARYNSIILRVFLDEGWDSVTYDRLAKETGLRKSTLQGYYPSNKDFAQAMQGKVMPIVLEQLDFSSAEAFVESWMKGLEQKRFSMIVRMFVSNSTKPHPNEFTQRGILGLKQMLVSHLPDENADEILESVLGKSVMNLLFSNKAKFS
ncbi:transcriptional regulator luxT [Vibrio sp. JCM 19236]|nr:transcriptional regulator luxT [Vibrio sp. JCM 19236]